MFMMLSSQQIIYCESCSFSSFDENVEQRQVTASVYTHYRYLTF